MKALYNLSHYSLFLLETHAIESALWFFLGSPADARGKEISTDTKAPSPSPLRLRQPECEGQDRERDERDLEEWHLSKPDGC